MDVTTNLPTWQNTELSAAERAEALLAELTTDEKVAQLYGVWVGASSDGGEVAPHQREFEQTVDLDALLPLGLGQLTRPFGSKPIDAAIGAASLMRTQERIMSASRFGIPAIAHEECLAGFAAWGATAYPVPLSWGATFNPDLIERMAVRIGEDMASVGIHQGLAPVLDVVRDARWGRVEETIGEDPYLVGRVGTAYVRGLESAGIIATLKHFVGYSASKAGRNLAPVSIGRRELADVLLPPFEMVLRETSVRSVMNSYTDLDGIPTAADAGLLTDLLRDTWGFEGTVVADYFSVAFLSALHGVASDLGDAARIALEAGIDVELPTVHAFAEPLMTALAEGRVREELINRALRRVLIQKVELGMLDPAYSPTPPVLEGVATGDADQLRGRVDLDSAANRELARELAEEAVVLLSNNGTLPLARPKRIAVVGPNATEELAVLGCYSFPAHVGVKHPDVPWGIELPTLLDALAREFPDSHLDHVRGTSVDGGETDEFEDAVAAARDADVVIVALGDRSGLFGRGTSGEGCDVETLALPGAQQQLLEAVMATGTPTIVTLLSGRPYFLGDAPRRAAAILQTFFLGQEGTAAIAGVLSGRVNPSGRLPVSIPAAEGAQPSTYLASPLAHDSGVSNVPTSAAFAFGHGLGYSSFAWSGLDASADSMPVDGSVSVSLTVRNTGERAGAEIIQLYLHDPVASVVRPVQRLIGFTRVELDAGESRRVTVTVSADLTSFTGADGARIVEPGEIILGFGRSSADIPLTHTVTVTGERREVDHTRALHPDFTVSA